MGMQKTHSTAEVIAASRELVGTSRLLIDSVQDTLAESKRLWRRQVAAGLFEPRSVLAGDPAQSDTCRSTPAP